MDHLHVGLGRTLPESLDQDAAALLFFLLGLFLVEGVASEAEVAHDLVVQVEEVEEGEDEHENWKDDHQLGAEIDFPEERKKGRLR